MNLECVWKSRNDTGANSTSAHADRFLASYSCNNFTIALSKSTQNPCILPARRRCGALSFMVFRTKEGAQARGLLAARTKYSRSKAQHIRGLCYKDSRNTAIFRTSDRAGRTRAPTHAHPVFDNKVPTPTRPARAKKRNGRPPACWASV